MKLQKRDNRSLFTRALYESPYDNENSFGPTYGAHREALELDRGAYVELQAVARELGLVFFATAFDEESADLLEDIGVAGVQDRLGRPPQHAAPAPRRGVRQAAARVDGRGDARGRRSRRRRHHGDQPAGLPAAVHGGLSGCRRGARARRDHDLSRALPGAGDRALGPPGRDRDGARRLHARRARDREALHVEPHGEGHRPRLLADARGDAEARPRPASRARRDRRRRQAAAAERGRAAAEDGKAARRRPSPAGGARARRRRPRREVPGRRRPAALSARRPARPNAPSPLLEDQAILAEDVLRTPSPAAAG